MNKETKILKNSQMGKFFFSLLAIFCVSLSALFAQNVSLKVENKSLAEFFAILERETPYRFSYIDSELPTTKDLSVEAKDEAIEELLRRVLRPRNLTFARINNNFAIKKAAPLKPIMVSGIVKDDKGEAIVGAVVIESGTNNGTITDLDGKYSVQVLPNATININYLGYDPQQKAVNNQSQIDFTLKEGAQALEEVVVVGYGVQSKRDVSTAIAQVKAEDIANLPSSDFRQALVGKMSGVSVMQPSGDPEGNVSVRVRGISSATAGNEPLYIIDGVPIENGLNNINQNDIASLEVLKDASAAAIYGSRGSNGVILITTKRGKSEKASVSYDAYVGFDEVTHTLDMMDAYEFSAFAKAGHDASYFDQYPNGTDPNGSRPQSFMNYPVELIPYLDGEQGLTDTNWQDEIFRTALSTSHNVSVSQKVGDMNYFASVGYLNKEGVIINSDFEKYSARLNIDGKSKKLKYGVNFAPSYSRSNRVNASGAYFDEGIVQTALAYTPLWPVYNEDGSFNYQGNGYWRQGTDYQHNELLNPVALATLKTDVVDRMSLVGKIYAGYDILEGLEFRTSVGGSYYGAKNDRYRPKALPLRGVRYFDAASPGEAYSSSSFFFNWLWENQLSYNTEFGGGDHRLNFVLVQSIQKETYKGSSVTATNFPNDYIQTIGGGTVSGGYSETSEWSLASYLARAQYSYKGRYMFSAAIRADGSSRFGTNNRWGYFPSASAAWRVSSEEFFKSVEALKFVSDMKLRASYGQTGNFQIGNYQHLSTLAAEDYILGASNGTLAYGYKPSGVDNPDLTWEKSEMINLGADFNFWNGYLTLSVEYYNSNTSDMLLEVPVSHLTGYTKTLMNIGEVNNRGWELSLGSSHSYQNGFSYSFNANYSANRNKVISLGANDTPIISSGGVSHAYYITEVGQPIGSYYLLVQDGVFLNEQELKAYPHFSNTRPGDFRFVDVDGDGVIDADKDRTIVGNYMPDFTYGFSGQLGYKNLDLSFQFQGVYGNEILNLSRRYIDNMEGNVNGSTIALDAWKSAEDIGSGEVNRVNRKQTGNNGRTSTWHVEDGSYLRLQNLAIGYTLPSKLSQRAKIERIRIYVSANNLHTWTSYSGYNPEVSARPDSALTPGEDYGTYPLARTYMLGANITF